jgi:hypothetical protein
VLVLVAKANLANKEKTFLKNHPERKRSGFLFSAYDYVIL